MKTFSTLKPYKLGLRDVVGTGKYQGAFVDDIIQEDPKYLGWMYTQGHLPLTEDALKGLVSSLCNIKASVRNKYLDDDSPILDVPF